MLDVLISIVENATLVMTDRAVLLTIWMLYALRVLRCYLTAN